MQTYNMGAAFATAGSASVAARREEGRKERGRGPLIEHPCHMLPRSYDSFRLELYLPRGRQVSLLHAPILDGVIGVGPAFLFLLEELPADIHYASFVNLDVNVLRASGRFLIRVTVFARLLQFRDRDFGDVIPRRRLWRGHCLADLCAFDGRGARVVLVCATSDLFAMFLAVLVARASFVSGLIVPQSHWRVGVSGFCRLRGFFRLDKTLVLLPDVLPQWHALLHLPSPSLHVERRGRGDRRH
mmetsp:Transcript_42500/g.117280  ORF Transcript_42500/g.117280 Transcript_42500/m.117280 type:complete len:243 (-) Transcript_42500:877-1605(-)